LGPLSVRAEGRLADERASVRASIDAPRAGRLDLTGSVPLAPEGNLDLRAEGRIDLAVANAALSLSGQRLAGTAAVDLAIRGNVTRPDVTGAVTLAGASFEDSGRGVRISDIRGRLAARGDSLVLEGVTAATPNGGTLTASGRIGLDADAGFPGEIAIQGRRAQLASGPGATAIADLDIALSGPLASRPRIAGRIDLVTLDLSVPDRLPTTQRPLPGTRHVAPPPAAAARLALERRRQNAGGRAAPFEAVLDLTIVAQNRIFVRGRGIEAELGGDLRLTGTTRDVVAVGAFDLRRGRLDILGQRLAFSRGRLDFTGDLTPSLDFMAETQAGDVTARIAVSGPASGPEFAITSDPDLPQDEVLSRLLFRRAAGGLSPGQALQLAQAVVTLSGGGNGAFEGLRRSLGVDSLDITTGASGGPAVGASRYISDRLRVGVTAGTRPEETGIQVDFDITRRLKLQGAAGADGRSSVGIAAEWEY
jgi:translocation and assembly module TamB